jgi:protein-S-isoprenylcysteine O-methyltransferase Ste14
MFRRGHAAPTGSVILRSASGTIVPPSAPGDRAGGTSLPKRRVMSRPIQIPRVRVPLGFALGALYLWLTPTRATTPGTVAVGALIAAVGLGMRAWAAGHIVKNDRLATTGPYAHTRNPLYFGSFLLGAGFAIAAHPLLVLLVIAFWLVVYGPTIERERRDISANFPGAYEEWARHVPAFVPRLTPWRQPGAERQPFSWSLYRRHREWQAALGFVGVMSWIVIRLARR